MKTSIVAFIVAAFICTSLPATLLAQTTTAQTNQQLIDKYNSGGKLTDAEKLQLKNAAPIVRGKAPEQRLVFRNQQTTPPQQESAYRKWLRSIGGKVR